jgi:hypothetical protein
MAERFFSPSAKLRWFVLMGQVCVPVHAGQVMSTSVEYHDGRFNIYAEVLIDLPESRVREILTDYESLPDVNEGIKKVEILLPRSPETVRMKLVSQVCLLFLCGDYSWVQDVESLPSGEITAIVDPQESDFYEGRSLWRLLAEGRQTRLVFEAYLIPNFWFPPLIGPWVIERKLDNALLETAAGVERMAAGW